MNGKQNSGKIAAKFRPKHCIVMTNCCDCNWSVKFSNIPNPGWLFWWSCETKLFHTFMHFKSRWLIFRLCSLNRFQFESTCLLICHKPSPSALRLILSDLFLQLSCCCLDLLRSPHNLVNYMLKHKLKDACGTWKTPTWKNPPWMSLGPRLGVFFAFNIIEHLEQSCTTQQLTSVCSFSETTWCPDLPDHKTWLLPGLYIGVMTM